MNAFKKYTPGSCQSGGCCGCISLELFTADRWVEETETSDVTLETIFSKDWLRLTGTVSPASKITHEAYLMEFFMHGEITVDVEGDLFVIDSVNGDVSANGNASTFPPSPGGLGAFVQIRVTPTHAHIMVYQGNQTDPGAAVLTVDRSSAPTGDFTLAAEDPYDEVTRFHQFTLSSSQVVFAEGSSYHDDTPDLECPFVVPTLCSHAWLGFVDSDPDNYPGQVFPGLSLGPSGVSSPGNWDESNVGGGGAFVSDTVGVKVVYVSWHQFSPPFTPTCGMDFDAEDPKDLLSATPDGCQGFSGYINCFVEDTTTPPGTCQAAVSHIFGTFQELHEYVFPAPTAGEPYPKPYVEVTLSTNESTPNASGNSSIIADVPVNDWETGNFSISNGRMTWTP